MMKNLEHYHNSTSIIIPSFNSARWIEQTIASCLTQVPFLKELLIIDDHSTDDSIIIIKEIQKNYPNLIKVLTNPKKGANSARNFGFHQSKGTFIQWLDSDDQLLSGKLENQITYFMQMPNVDVVYSDWKIDTYINNRFASSEIKIKGHYEDFLFELVKNNWNPPNCYLLRRSVAEKLFKLNGWNEKRKVEQDREYFTLVAILGFRFGYCPGIYAVYNRWNPKSISNINRMERLNESNKVDNILRSIIEKECLEDKYKYMKILNSRQLTTILYNPKIEINAVFLPWQIDYSYLSTKVKLISGLLYLFMLIKYTVNRLR